MHRKDMIQMIAVIGLIIVMFVVYQAYLKPPAKPINNTSANSTVSDKPDTKPDTKPDGTSKPTEPVEQPKAETGIYARIARENAKTTKLANKYLTATFSERGATLQYATFMNAEGETVYYRTPNDPTKKPEDVLTLIEGGDVIEPLALRYDGKDQKRNKARWELIEEKKNESLTYRFPAGNGSQDDGTVIYKTIKIQPEAFRLDISIRIENNGVKDKYVTVGLWGPVGITNDGADTGAEHARVALYGSTESLNWSDLEQGPQLKGFNEDFNDTLEEAQEDNGHENDFLTNLEYDDIDDSDRFLLAHGLSTQYFLAVLTSDPDNPDTGWLGHIAKVGKGNTSRAAVSLYAPEVMVESKSKATVKMAMYIGPRDKTFLEAAWDSNPPEDGDVEQQWTGLASSGFWDLLSAPLVLLLAFLGKLVGPGLAIILLTLLVRFGLSPLSYRGQKNMAVYTQKMKIVKPRLDAIKEKYKDKKEKDSQLRMLTETREVMKSEGVGFVPVAGCLPMFLQLPIFIGLYRAFGNSFFLRQESFLWISDLTLPDATFGLSTNVSGFLGMLGHNGILTLNILPMLWIVLSILQFKTQPKPDDPQQAAMQKQMGCMFPIMGLFFYGFASGFAFYFIISSIYSMGESRLIKHNLRKQGVMPDPKNEVKVNKDDKPEYHTS